MAFHSLAQLSLRTFPHYHKIIKFKARTYYPPKNQTCLTLKKFKIDRYKRWARCGELIEMATAVSIGWPTRRTSAQQTVRRTVIEHSAELALSWWCARTSSLEVTLEATAFGDELGALELWTLRLKHGALPNQSVRT